MRVGTKGEDRERAKGESAGRREGGGRINDIIEKRE